MAIEFPWQAWAETERQKRQREQQLTQNLQGMVSGVGDIAADLRQRQLTNQLSNLIAKSNQPTPQGVQGTATGGVVPNFMQQAGPVLAQLDPLGTVQSLIKQNDPMERLRMQRLQQLVAGGKPETVASGPEGPGSPPRLTPSQELRKQFIDAMNKRTDVLGQRVQYGQIDRLARATGIQPQLLKQIQTNNVRADRALSVLSQGTVYPLKKNLALIDLAGIMQGGAPQLAELHNTSFPTWQDTASRLQTWATGNPNVPIPPQLVSEIKQLVQGVKEVDNEYIRQNADFQSKMLGPTIEGFEKNFAPIVRQGTERFIKGGVKQQGQEDPLGIR